MARRLLLAFLFFLITAPAAAASDGLSGRVVDPQQRPVAGAQVLVLRGAAVVATVTTTADGRYGPLQLPAGDVTVMVAAPGLRAAPRAVALTGGDVVIDLAMELAAVSESVVVGAAQVDRPLSWVTDSVTVIDRRELDARQIETATDVLRLVPGFSVVASGGRGALTSLFPRGGESDYTLVMVDGLALNMFGGGFDAAHLATAGVDRLEVVRGPQSALFGGGAIGGVVNVTSRSGGPLTGDALIEGGSLGYSRVVGSAAGARGAWFWGGGFERLATDGDTSYRESIGGPVSNDDYERVLGSFSGGWSDRSTRRVRVDARFGRDERGNPGPYGSDPYGLYPGLDTVSRGFNTTRGVAGSAVFGDPGRMQHRVQAAWSDAPSRYVSPYGESHDATQRLSGRYQLDLERQALGLSAGWEILHEQADNTFITGDMFQPVPVTRVVSGWFTEARVPAGQRAAITAGLRLERIARGALEADPNGFAPRPAFDTDVVWSLNPKISAAWFVRGTSASDGSTGWTKVRAGAGTGIKPPTAFEIAFTDNPSLKPERSRSVDAGIEHVFPGALLAVDATWFANRFDDLIIAVGGSFTGASRYRTDNIANARAQGVELGLRWQSGVGLSARAAYTWLDTEVLSVDDAPGEAPSPFTVGDPLVRRARHQGSFEVRYTHDRAQGFLMMNGRGEMADLEPNWAAAVLPSPGYVVFTLGGSVRLGQRLEAYGRVANLLNREYEDALGYPALPRTATVGLRVAVSR
jgi:outer membrane cobalamin receptor